MMLCIEMGRRGSLSRYLKAVELKAELTHFYFTKDE